MKKNKMMRIAAVLLIVTLLSTCAISGTFAKYVAKADMTDSARVAKWGIKIETSGSLFSDTYAADDADYIAAGGTISVDSADGAKVVAPGTTSYTYKTQTNDDGITEIVYDDETGEPVVQDMGFTARVYGKPEVATRFSLKLNAGLTDIFMPFAEGYTDLSEAVKDGEVKTFDFGSFGALSDMDNDYATGYSPVKWDVKVTRVKDNGEDGRSFTLSKLAAEVANSAGMGEFREAFFTNEGISITDAKTFVQEINNPQHKIGGKDLKTFLVDKMKEKFTSLEIRNLNIDFAPDGSITIALDFDPNQNVNYRFEGGWTWAFEQSAPSFISDAAAKNAYTDLCNKADTYLGNVAAGVISAEANDVPGNEVDPKAADVSTKLDFGFEASAVQID